MKDDQKNSKWKTNEKNHNGRRPKQIKMEDDQKNSKWKTKKKKKMQTGR